MHKVIFASNALELNTGEVLSPSGSHQHHIVLLQGVALTRDVRYHLLPIAESDTTAFALGGVRLLGLPCHRL